MSLSERVRPDIEAAPWVIEEIKRLEKTQEELLAAVKKVYELADDAPECDNEKVEYALNEIVTETYPIAVKFDLAPHYVAKPTDTTKGEDHG